MIRALVVILALWLAVAPTVAFSNPPTVSEAESTCRDLKGGFAKIGLDPVNKNGASAIEVHEEGANLREIPEEGMSFEWMEGSKACYINGLVPSQAANGRKVYAVVIEATGEVVKLANCKNRIKTSFRFPPVPSTPCEPVTVIKTVEIKVECPICPTCTVCPTVEVTPVPAPKPGKGFWCFRGLGHGAVCAVGAIGAGWGLSTLGGGGDHSVAEKGSISGITSPGGGG